MFSIFWIETFCQLFIQMSVGIRETLLHFVKVINFILYVLCFLFIILKNPTTSLLQDHKDILINFLLKVLLFCIYYLKI